MSFKLGSESDFVLNFANDDRLRKYYYTIGFRTLANGG
jgi:hypothetical protein